MNGSFKSCTLVTIRYACVCHVIRIYALYSEAWIQAPTRLCVTNTNGSIVAHNLGHPEMTNINFLLSNGCAADCIQVSLYLYPGSHTESKWV